MRSLILLYILTVCCACDAYAQIERVLPRRNQSSFEDTRFVVGFMQNDVFVPGVYEPPDDGLILQIFIASDYNATVTIDLPNGSRFIRNVQANTVYTETLDPHLMMHVSERPMRQSVFITSDVPVVVYAINTLAASTDTYIALPMKHLGTEYRAVTRTNDFYPPSDASSINQRLVDTTQRQAEFMVMAVEDNTMVQYTPSSPTEGGVAAGQMASVLLQRGECFLVKSRKDGRGRGDLTGSLVSSTRPVAFLSGNARVSIPLSSTTRISKDHLVEMLPPTSLWGNEHATVPFGSGITSGDFIRIVASQDNTTVTFTSAVGTGTAVLANAGDWVEYRDVRFPTRWESDRPTLVAQFMVSQMYAGSNYADPAMVIVPPVQYFATRALFQFPKMQFQTGVPQPQPFYYFVNVLCESKGLSTFTINGRLVSQLEPDIFTQTIPGTDLHWAQLSLNAGVYVLEVDSGAFSGVMYATTFVDSYANMFGASFEPRRRLDISPPNYHLANDCFRLQGVIADTAMDTGFTKDLYEVVVLRDRTTNYTWQLDGPLDTNGTVTIDASVSDPWKDARIVIQAWDAQGNGKEWLYTYHAPKVSVPATMKFQGGSGQICSTLVVKNTDTTSLVIPRIRLVGDKRYSIRDPLPDTVRLGPGDSLLLDVCFTFDGSAQPAYGTIFIDLPCGLKKEVRLSMTLLASLATTDVDFGAVRIGDTLCRSVSIVNNGTIDVVIDSLTLSATYPDYRPNIVALRLPRTLAPGDTLRMEVCFTPSTETATSRTDTVHASPLLTDVVRYRGRGIRPRLADVVVDWNKRRVGTTNDTTFTLRNTGSAPCTVRAIDVAGDTVQYSAEALLATRGTGTIYVASAGVAISDATFSPTAVGRWSTTTNVLVDWKYHDTVTVRFLGEGTLPVIVVQDIDLGTIRLDERKDSLCRIYAAAGTEALTVDRVSTGGPEVAAFTLQPTVLAPQTLAIGQDVSGIVGFVPQRIGRHDAWIDITNDAAPAYGRVVTRVHLTAMVVGLDTTLATTSIAAAATMVACTETPVTVQFRNQGNTIIKLNGIEMRLNGGTVAGDTTLYPVMVQPDSLVEITVQCIADAGSDGVFTAIFRYNDTLTATETHRFTLELSPSTIDLPAGVTTSPGAEETMQIVAGVQAALSVPIPFEVAIRADAERYRIVPGTVVATILERGVEGTLELRMVSNGPLHTFTSTRPLFAPFTVRWGLPVGILWKDATLSTIHGGVMGTNCTVNATDSAVFGVSLCASNLRAIRFGAMPVIDVQVAPMPATSYLDLRCTSTADEVVQVDLIDQTGARITIGQNLSLKKGTQYLKFPCSRLAAGWYQVVVVGMSGSLVVPVIIVN
ncbi:MAG: choice-of-anchor D domain-containing protein [Bacteroidetes bacterium]|nr:choice-of-anchor D domain-containing protein [Bacteroidota bacterium]